jgi:uncharacterized protein DUF1844
VVAMTEKKDDRKREEIRVVDRRQFSPDGTRRTPDAPSEDTTIPHAAPAAASRATPAGASRPAAAAPSREEQAASAHFVGLVRNLAATAAANLGEMPNPFTGQVEVDVDGARQVIDLLQALQMKTRGNLTADETRLLESLLYDLKMAVVNLQKHKTSKTS